MTVPSVERRNRRGPIEWARRFVSLRQMLGALVVITIWSVLEETVEPRQQLALACVAAGLAVAFAIVTRLNEPKDRRRSVRWQLLYGLVVGFLICAMSLASIRPWWLGVTIGMSLCFLVLSIIGNLRDPSGSQSS